MKNWKFWYLSERIELSRSIHLIIEYHLYLQFSKTKNETKNYTKATLEI